MYVFSVKLRTSKRQTSFAEIINQADEINESLKSFFSIKSLSGFASAIELNEYDEGKL